MPSSAPDASAARQGALFAQVMLRALAREEALGRRPKRLLEPGLATWTQFRGRLRETALLELVLEDAAVSQPEPFDAGRVLGNADLVACVPAAEVRGWLDVFVGEAPADAASSSAAYIQAQAKLLGLPTKIARSDLPVVRAHQHVLELPGTGGQLTHHLLETHPDLPIREVFTVACGSWQELALAGLVCVDKGLVGEPPASLDPKLDAARAQTRSFDFVLGVDAGLFSAAQLESWFPSARVLLV
ncbi:MAG: hypothetical protein HY744_01360 [Deltaproteobacteria bacterium]|nr:hypothetical protein [Deltaproteobacteria bacterium]